MNNFIFQNATKVYFGKGCVKEYLACLTKNANTILLAYGGGSIKRNGVYDEITSILKEAGKTIVEFSGIMSNPTYAKVQEGAKLARANQADMILAVGGGSAMDCCKAVSMRPDLYAAYLHGASQWDGDYAPIAKNGVAVYIFMAENDEYYGSERAWDAYNSLYDAYSEAGWSEEQIADVLQIQTPDDEWFAQRGITGNYHGGGNVVFGEDNILNWILSHTKEENIS